MRLPLWRALATALSLSTAACGLVLALPDGTTIAGDASAVGAVGDAATSVDGAASDATAVVEASSCGGADLAYDPLNCGLCGRSCLGAKCEQGRCAPQKLAATDSAVAITVDQDFVYWLEDAYVRAVRRVPKAGGVTELLAQPGPFLEEQLVNDGAQFFWIEGNSPRRLVSCPRAGCPDSGPTQHFSATNLASLTIGDGKLYASSSSAGADFTWHVPLDGGAAELLRDAGASWLAATANVLVRGGDDVRRSVPSAGAADEYVGAILGDLTGVVTDGTWTAWSEELDDGGGSVRWTSGTNPTVAPGAWPSAVAIDKGYVYWANRAKPTGTGNVVACPLQGCPPEGPLVILGPLDRPTAIVIDATHVYITNDAAVDGVGVVWRVPKL